jgi:hypothetical protein
MGAAAKTDKNEQAILTMMQKLACKPTMVRGGFE